MSGESTRDTGAASELAELVKIAQDADAQWMRANRGKFGTWQRVADDQARRLIVAALEQYATGHASYQASEHGGAASELRDQLIDALLDAPNEIFEDEPHRNHKYAIGCPVCRRDVPAIVDTVLVAIDAHPVLEIRPYYPTQDAYDAACKALETQRQRAERAEAAIERVRRLCEMTINGSVRVQAIQQAEDTLAALGQPPAEKETQDPNLMCRCGHITDDHDAGECWAHVDGDQCRCSWHEPAPGPEIVSVRPGEPPREITDTPSGDLL